MCYSNPQNLHFKYRYTVLLSFCDSLDTFKDILIDILTACTNEYDGKIKDSSEINPPSENPRICLLDLIKGNYYANYSNSWKTILRECLFSFSGNTQHRQNRNVTKLLFYFYVLSNFIA